MTPVSGPFCEHCKRENPLIGRVLAGLYRDCDRHVATIGILSEALLQADPVAWQATMRRFDMPARLGEPATPAGGQGGA